MPGAGKRRAPPQSIWSPTRNLLLTRKPTGAEMPRGGGVKEKANKWKALPPRGVIGQLCGKLLLPEERKQWKQAAALLVGLKIRKGLAAEDLTSEVDWLLHRSSISRTCELQIALVTTSAW